MTALPSNSVTELLKHPHSVALANSRNSGHGLDKYICLLNSFQPRVRDLDLKP